MALKAGLLLVAGVSGVLGQYKSNSGVDANYFVGPFNDAEFPSAMGFCQPTTVVGGVGNIATCIDDEVVRYEAYSSSICFGDPTDVPIYYTSGILPNSSSEDYLLDIIEADFDANFADIFSDKTIDDVTIEVTQTGTGSLFDFKCDGTDDYTQISFQVSPCDSDRFFTYYAAINTCVQNCGEGGTDPDLEPSEYTSLSVYCNANLAELQYFENPDTCDFSNCTQANFYQVRNVTTECGYMLSSGNSDVYGFIVNCTVDPIAGTGGNGETEDGASGVHGVIALLVSAIVTIVAMFA